MKADCQLDLLMQTSCYIGSLQHCPIQAVYKLFCIMQKIPLNKFSGVFFCHSVAPLHFGSGVSFRVSRRSELLEDIGSGYIGMLIQIIAFLYEYELKKTLPNIFKIMLYTNSLVKLSVNECVS